MTAQTFAPLESATVAVQIQQRLEEAIHTGQLKPGQRLIEAELAEAMQVSRASFREAIRLLQSKGLVVNLHRRGTYVAKLTPESVRENYTVRILLETYAFRHAVEHADTVLLDRLEELVAELKIAAEQRNYPRIVDLDLEVHREICAFTGNKTLLDIWAGLVSQARALLLTKYQLFDDSQEIAWGHQLLIDAIRSGNPDKAEIALKQHILNTHEQVLDALDHHDS
jgi:DNA-binding GntR family transcriptional regulator